MSWCNFDCIAIERKIQLCDHIHFFISRWSKFCQNLTTPALRGFKLPFYRWVSCLNDRFICISRTGNKMVMENLTKCQKTLCFKRKSYFEQWTVNEWRRKQINTNQSYQYRVRYFLAICIKCFKNVSIRYIFYDIKSFPIQNTWKEINYFYFKQRRKMKNVWRFPKLLTKVKNFIASLANF